MTFAQLGVHGDIMLNSSLALVGVDMHFETGILRSQAEQVEVLFLNGAQTSGGAINTHSEVALRTVNSTRFDFPSGKQGVYLPFSLSANAAVTVSGELIAATLRGERYFSPTISEKLQRFSSKKDIDYIDRLLLKGLSKGMKQNEIADYFIENCISLTPSAIEKRVKRLKEYFNAKTSLELMSIVSKHGYI